MVFTDITRRQAFLTHLAVSLVIFFVLAYLIVFHWYPSYYFHIDGGYRGLATIFFVDVVLGPGLTLLVFKPGKPGLKFDMAMIVIVQLAALTWGINSVVSERPMLTVFYDGKFSCMTASDVAEFDLDRLNIEDKPPPLLAVLPRPNTHKAYQEMMMEAFRRGTAEIYVFNEKLLPMDVVGTVHVLNYKLDVANSFIGTEAEKEKYRKAWNEYLEENPDAVERFLYYPMSCRYQKVVAIFDPENSEIVDYLPVYTDRAVSAVKVGLSKEELEEFERRKKEQEEKLIN